MPIDLYYLQLSPPCRAVHTTAKQLGIDVNIKNVDLAKGEHLTPEYLKLNPTHKVPTLVDDQFVLFESRAIMQYLCNRYAPGSSLYPKDPKQRALVDRWLNTDMSFFLSLVDALVLRALFGKVPTEQQVTAYKNNAKLVDTLIGDNKYIAGGEQLTIADLSLLATTTLLSIEDYQDFDECPNLKRWFTALQTELPYFDEINDQIGEGFKLAGQHRHK